MAPIKARKTERGIRIIIDGEAELIPWNIVPTVIDYINKLYGHWYEADPSMIDPIAEFRLGIAEVLSSMGGNFENDEVEEYDQDEESSEVVDSDGGVGADDFFD